MCCLKFNTIKYIDICPNTCNTPIKQISITAIGCDLQNIIESIKSPFNTILVKHINAVIKFTVNIKWFMVGLYVILQNAWLSVNNASPLIDMNINKYPIHIVSGLYTNYHALLAYCYRANANKTAPAVIIIAISTFFGYNFTSLFFIREK